MCIRDSFHGWPGNDETIDTVMFDPNQKPDTARAENSIFGSPEADKMCIRDRCKQPGNDDYPICPRLQYGEQCVPIDAADTEDREIFR